MRKFLSNKIKMDNLNKNKNDILSYITAEQSKLIDEYLMGSVVGYSVDQLMEVAGLSAALCVADALKNISDEKNIVKKRILNISGPGSNFIR